MKKVKVLVSAIIISFITVFAFCFDWPQQGIISDKFFSFFGQLRGNTISNSLIFSDSSPIKAADKGNIIALISEHENSCWFESTLGNAIVLAHNDNLLTIYGNLDNSESFQNIREVEKGDDFGTAGNSAWQTSNTFLEFQIIDAQNGTFINPYILMPRINDSYKLNLSNITLKAKNGTTYDLQTQRSIPAGVYYLYIRKQNNAMLYKSSILLNGTETDFINYDTLKSENGVLNAKGRNSYSKDMIYPDDKSQLAGQVLIPHGKNTLTVTISTILDDKKSLTYNITGY